MSYGRSIALERLQQIAKSFAAAPPWICRFRHSRILSHDQPEETDGDN